ncbi:glycosyltransferase [Rhodoferax sp.]|uniref:glycosyltransferase family 2 protein n=1 Tax=Rhodoferax sp. TaxID=50421 RepID=UPI00284B9CE1|nr:glycosyltransferase [Rhodoferax sp.]MDR3371648.1 glycosyltransferase [Rhodoferax sp.]
MNQKPPVVSVCVANYNGMAVLDDCLKSVLRQQGNIPVEILLHDDASNDGSVTHIREHYPDVVLIESDVNVGFCIANNRMVTRARGQFLLLLNNDAALHPDALQALLQEATKLGQPAILTLPQYDATTGALVDRGCLLDPFYNPVPNLNPNRADVAMVIGACLWIPKTLWDELEGFPEWFGSIAEDMYLCCRARLAGYAVRALAVSGYRHWQGKSFGGNKVTAGRLATTFYRRVLSERNKTFVMMITFPAPLAMLLVPLHLVLLLLEGAALSLLHLNGSYLQRIYLPVLSALWRHSRELRANRFSAQNSRRITSADFFSAFDCYPHKLRMLWRHGLPILQ